MSNLIMGEYGVVYGVVLRRNSCSEMRRERKSKNGIKVTSGWFMPVPDPG